MTSVAVESSKTTVNALSVENVSHAYGARIALHKVSFAVAPASFSVLLGLNGAGKSTLFSVITHLYASRSGAVRIFGHDVARESGDALSLLGVVFQQRTLDLDLSSNKIWPITAPCMELGGAKQARDKSRNSPASAS